MKENLNPARSIFRISMAFIKVVGIALVVTVFIDGCGLLDARLRVMNAARYAEYQDEFIGYIWAGIAGVFMGLVIVVILWIVVITAHSMLRSQSAVAQLSCVVVLFATVVAVALVTPRAVSWYPAAPFEIKVFIRALVVIVGLAALLSTEKALTPKKFADA